MPKKSFWMDHEPMKPCETHATGVGFSGVNGQPIPMTHAGL